MKIGRREMVISYGHYLHWLELDILQSPFSQRGTGFDSDIMAVYSGISAE